MAQLIIGLAGSIGSGKWTAAAYLSSKYGAETFTFSDPLRNVLKALYVDPSRTEIQFISKLLRDGYGSDLLSRVAKRAIDTSERPIVVIDGARRISDLENGIAEDPNFRLLFIDADIRVRYDRIKYRGQNRGDSEKTFEQFLVEENGETEVSIQALRPQAHTVIANDKTEAEFYAAIDAFVQGNLQNI